MVPLTLNPSRSVLKIPTVAPLGACPPQRERRALLLENSPLAYRESFESATGPDVRCKAYASVLRDLAAFNLPCLAGKIEWMIVAGLDVPGLGVVRPGISHDPLATLIRQSNFGDQLGRLIAVLERHHQPERRSVLGCQRLAVHSEGEQRMGMQQLIQFHVIVIHVRAVKTHPGGAGLGVGVAQQFADAEAVPLDPRRPA